MKLSSSDGHHTQLWGQNPHDNDVARKCTSLLKTSSLFEQTYYFIRTKCHPKNILFPYCVKLTKKVTRKLNVFAFASLYTYLIWGKWHSNASTCWTDMLEGCSGWETQRLLELTHQLPAVQSVAEIDKPWWSVHHWAQIVD